jgi:protein involved in plasmid replication-relaxation
VNPAGSSNALRSDVLRVLGVLKVATADQVQRLAAPHLTFRHLDKPTEAARKEARTRAHRAAAQDLKRHGLVVDAGHSRAGEKLWSLTAAGLEAAAGELGRPMQEMGGLARGVGRTGAPHALCVGETVWALSRPAPDLTRLQEAPPGALEAAQAVPPGVGGIESWATEVPLPATGTWATAGRGGAQADAVLAAPEAGVPLLFVEVDTCHMDAQRIATKIGKYMRFLRRRVKDAEGHKRATLPMWRSRWDYPDGLHESGVHPPLLLVFHRLGPRQPETSWKQAAGHAREHWQGDWVGEYHDYDGKIPLLFTTIDLLRQHGPTGPAFRRAGRKERQTLHDAVGNPRRTAAVARQRVLQQEQARRYAQEQAAAREARRPTCTQCGQKFSDAHWEYTHRHGGGWDQHPGLCENCAEAAAARARAEREAAKREACRSCGRPRQDDQWNEKNPELRHVPAPDGVNCAACRQELNPFYTRPGRLARFLNGY